MKKDTDRDTRDVGEIERLLLYLGVYDRGMGVPDPMFFDGAAPGWEDQFSKFMNGVGQSRKLRDSTADRIGRFEGSVIFRPELPSEAFRILGCRPMGFREKERLIALHGPRFSRRLIEPTRHIFTPLDRIMQTREIAIREDGIAKIIYTGYSTDAQGAKWADITSSLIAETQTSIESLALDMAIGITKAVAEQWSVSVRFAPDCPSIRLFSDPTGIRDFFRFRDIEDGKARRSALANWVRNHWRADRHDLDSEVYVREHLRGRTRFSWHGLGVDITIPQADIGRSVALAESRRKMTQEESRRSRLRVASLSGI